MKQSPYFAQFKMSGRRRDARQGKTMGRSEPQSNLHLWGASFAAPAAAHGACLRIIRFDAGALRCVFQSSPSAPKAWLRVYDIADLENRTVNSTCFDAGRG
jgi:hypothetical protein